MQHRGSKSDLENATVITLDFSLFLLKDLQGVVQQQRADMDSARDALTSLSRSHPSQELLVLSSDLTSIAKRTEVVAHRCARTRGSLQEGLQLHFNGETLEKLTYVRGVFCFLFFSVKHSNSSK